MVKLIVIRRSPLIKLHITWMALPSSTTGAGRARGQGGETHPTGTLTQISGDSLCKKDGQYCDNLYSEHLHEDGHS